MNACWCNLSTLSGSLVGRWGVLVAIGMAVLPGVVDDAVAQPDRPAAIVAAVQTPVLLRVRFGIH